MGAVEKVERSKVQKADVTHLNIRVSVRVRVRIWVRIRVRGCLELDVQHFQL